LAAFSESIPAPPCNMLTPPPRQSERVRESESGRDRVRARGREIHEHEHGRHVFLHPHSGCVCAGHSPCFTSSHSVSTRGFHHRIYG
jgi:hypothetical protein